MHIQYIRYITKLQLNDLIICHLCADYVGVAACYPSDININNFILG